MCVCGDGRVERARLCSPAVSGKMDRLCPSPVLQAAGAFGEGKSRLELCDEPQRRSKESGFAFSASTPLSLSLGKENLKSQDSSVKKARACLAPHTFSTHFPFLCFVFLRSQAHHCLFPLVSREDLFLGPWGPHPTAHPSLVNHHLHTHTHTQLIFDNV